MPAAEVPEPPSAEADVIVVGAGPAGATTAYHLAQAGLEVLLLEKSTFPREKVCGDGLTPRAVQALIRAGVDFDSPGWIRTRGLRILGGDGRVELPWPELASFPDFGVVCPRLDFDRVLAQHAVAAGAKLRMNTTVTGPIIDARRDRIVGVRARTDAGEQAFAAPVVVAADGNSTRLSLGMGLPRRDDRPLGVAMRRYFTSPRHDEEYLESWLDLWDGTDLLAGYGWVFGVGDGTANVGIGLLNANGRHREYRDLFERWLANMPAEWGFRDDNATGPVRGGALPMGFNRTPHYTRGLLLVGDAGGMVNPFTGEGISYAMESGEMAAEVIARALARPTDAQRERVLEDYPRALGQAFGGYFAVGRVFLTMIGNPRFMRFVTDRGLHHRTAMRFTLKLLSNLTDPRSGDAMDLVINGLNRIAPTA